jgi:glycosyltransferase involved in cell wall biosynthesis
VLNEVSAERATARVAATVPRIAAVIPAYRASRTIDRVVGRALDVADVVIVVDDACPDRSATFVRRDERVHVIVHEQNRGVGGATKTGIAEALRLGAEYVVKIDSDDQMDTSYVPFMIEILDRFPEIELVKGNRFSDPATLRTMPALRLIGNAGLTLLVKFSSGYWTLVDPTNGYFAVRAETFADAGPESLADRYFFEIDLLCAFGLRRRTIAELEMPAIYAGESSSLSIPRVLATFPLRLLNRFLRRLVVQYLVVELNVGSLCALIGFPLLLFGVVFGAHEWSLSAASGIPRPTGTIILSLLVFMIGFQLALQALLFDVQFGTRTVKLRRDTHAGRSLAAAVRSAGPAGGL